MHSHGSFKIQAVNTTIANTFTLRSGNETAEPLSSSSSSSSSSRLPLPLLDVVNATVRFGDLKIAISDSKLTWMYNVLKATFGGVIKGVAQLEIANVAMNVLPAEVNKAIATLPETIPVWKRVHVAYQTTANSPTITAAGMEIADTAAFLIRLSDHEWKVCPVRDTTPTPTPSATDNQNDDPHSGAPWSSGKMVQVRVKQHVFSCLLW